MTESAGKKGEHGLSAAAPYVAPFVVYLLGTALAARVPAWYPLAYAGVVVATGVVMAVLLLRGRRILRPHGRIAAGVAVGLVGIAIWIALGELRLEDRVAGYLPSVLRPGQRVSFNPFEELPAALAAGFVAVRLIGLAVVVPVAEELFWRGFLLRWFVSADWEEVPLGKYTAASFWAVTLLFTLAHPEWLAAACYCALLNGLLYWKRDLWVCVVAHAVSNLALGIYVLGTGSWHLW